MLIVNRLTLHRQQSGPLIQTTEPADTHHCAEPLGFTPMRFFACKTGAQGRTRTDTYFYART
jgi:hypothetical protein